MRIAHIAPLAEAVPPKLYGGTERVIWWLTEALVDQGHDVTLFAAGDSVTSARLVPCAPTGLRLSGINDHLASLLAMLDRVLVRADDFDILHFHIDFLHFPTFRHMTGKCLTTLHGRQDFPDFWPAYRTFPEMNLVSISDNQRLPIAHANFVSTVHHGMPRNLIPFGEGAGDYLAFIGRISPEKRPDRAIEIARRAGMKLKIAAKVDRADTAYFEERIKPLLDDPAVEFIGEIGDAEKPDFLGNARALLFPIDWPEPFGLVMIEAMAAGTPVIAWRNGSTPEVIEHGRSGFLVESIDEAVAAVDAAASLSRRLVRTAFEERFTADRMARDYVALYQALGADTRGALFGDSMTVAA
ncbi:glycosyltransferase family 4 protein [Sphingosinicella sp. LHD-64]|uniref:glycosyltransferase family 4 protein n=1 Tax=Sphingosinicella sp. LHD-64 TaxID=3072139 RepID=UPI00280CA9CD|nr:glycosyltransferase family 4 protein [Sphingosinicella sp. LHD-64]MDQ8755716.1 glycosyltransferase family 4 protein [Sphingosinicella sp. LHD-64]